MAPTLLYVRRMKALARIAKVARVAFTVAALLGCDVSPPEAEIYPSVANNGMEDQGRYLIGNLFDLWKGTTPNEHFSVSVEAKASTGQPITLSIPSAAVLASSIPYLSLQGTVLSGPHDLVKLRIAAVVQVVERVPTMTKVILQKQEGTSWVAGPCNGAFAIPLAGIFQRDGLHVPRRDRITFACEDDSTGKNGGVAAKCAIWGYPPGPAGSGVVWDTHQACTRMARADICSDGIPRTRNDTRIWFFDTISGNDIPDADDELMLPSTIPWPPPPDAYYFEAMWRPGSDHAGCVSKLRWNDLNPGPLCNGALPDPRQGADGDGLTEACENITIENAIEEGGAILFNQTQYNDLKLSIWRAMRPSGEYDYTTTVRGFRGGGKLPTVHPFWENVGEIYQAVYAEAYLIRVMPMGREDEFREVSTFVNRLTGDRVLAWTSDPAFGPGSNYDREFFEGYVYNTPQGASNTALRIWHNAATKDRVTVTGALGPIGLDGLPVPGYVEEKLLGYITDPDGR